MEKEVAGFSSPLDWSRSRTFAFSPNPHHLLVRVKKQRIGLRAEARMGEWLGKGRWEQENFQFPAIPQSPFDRRRRAKDRNFYLTFGRRRKGESRVEVQNSSLSQSFLCFLTPSLLPFIS